MHAISSNMSQCALVIVRNPYLCPSFMMEDVFTCSSFAGTDTRCRQDHAQSMASRCGLIENVISFAFGCIPGSFEVGTAAWSHICMYLYLPLCPRMAREAMPLTVQYCGGTMYSWWRRIRYYLACKVFSCMPFIPFT